MQEENLYRDVDLHRYIIEISKINQDFHYTIGFNKIQTQQQSLEWDICIWL